MNVLVRLPAALLLAAGLASPAAAGRPAADCPAGGAADGCEAPLWPAQADATADASEEEDAAGGGEHTVMARGVKYAPAILFIEPGDTVHFENMPTHNVETVEPLVPEGQEKINTEIGENVSLTFDEVGLVTYKCTPHWGNRMGGIIVVGEPEDPMALAEEYLALTEEHPETLPARGLIKDLMEELEERGLSG